MSNFQNPDTTSKNGKAAKKDKKKEKPKGKVCFLPNVMLTCRILKQNNSYLFYTPVLQSIPPNLHFEHFRPILFGLCFVTAIPVVYLVSNCPKK